MHRLHRLQVLSLERVNTGPREDEGGVLGQSTQGSRVIGSSEEWLESVSAQLAPPLAG